MSLTISLFSNKWMDFEFPSEIWSINKKNQQTFYTLLVINFRSDCKRSARRGVKELCEIKISASRGLFTKTYNSCFSLDYWLHLSAMGFEFSRSTNRPFPIY